MNLNSKSHWCDVHETTHPLEVTITYTVETETAHGHTKSWSLTLCNEVAMTLGLTQRDPVLTADFA